VTNAVCLVLVGPALPAAFPRATFQPTVLFAPPPVPQPSPFDQAASRR
jgi:hypothetical protein